ncbi:MAG: hypothetical protein JNL90_13440 [Planctomycetes bacterium]|nr:hypothetical protein [Planctomycetota bacterium]
MAGATDFDREVDPQQQIRQFLGVIKRGWLAIATCLGTGLLVGVALFLFIPKTYVSTSKLELQSSWMFDALAEARDIDTIPFSTRRRNLEDQLRATEYVEPVLNDLEWDDWTRAKEGGETEKRVFLKKVKDKIECRVTAGELGERLIFLNFAWHDRDRAAEFCAAMTKFWLDTAIERYTSEAGRRLSLAEEVLGVKKAELDEARLALERFEVRNGISAIDQRQGSQGQLDRLRTEQSTLAIAIADLEAQIEGLDARLTAVNAQGELLLPPTLSADSPLTNTQKADALLQIEATIKTIEARLISGYNPERDRLLLQLKEALKTQLVAASQLGSTTSSVELPGIPNPDWKLAKDQRDGLYLQLQGKIAQRSRVESDLARVAESLETLPEVLRVHNSLLADITLKQQIVYDETQALQPLRDKKLQVERRGPGQLVPFRQLEKPVPATIPSAFLGTIALAVSTLLGLGLALLSIIGREFLRSSFRSSEQARRTLRLPVLGEVAPIQTVPELRRARLQRVVQVAASLLLLGGLASVIWVCMAHPNDLPRGLVEWAMDLRASLA